MFTPHVVWSSLARTDNHGFLAPCTLLKCQRQERRGFTSVQMVHTRPTAAGLFGRCISESDVFSQKIRIYPGNAKDSEIMFNAFRCYHPQDPLGFPGSLRGSEPKSSKEWPSVGKGSGLSFHHSDHQGCRVSKNSTSESAF